MRPQMPFVKKTRMASRGPQKVAACLRVVLRVSAQNLGRAEVTARLSFMNTLHQAEGRTGD